jgi:hypothetical protein
MYGSDAAGVAQVESIFLLGGLRVRGVIKLPISGRALAPEVIGTIASAAEAGCQEAALTARLKACFTLNKTSKRSHHWSRGFDTVLKRLLV